jgi:murein DD-endopeptidase
MFSLPRRWYFHAVVGALLGFATGCVSLADHQQSEPIATASSAVVGDEIALRAIALVGKPYVYGGADLQGFDCSGMVYFIHHALGFEVPRTAAEQARAAVSVSKSALQPGDLLFFKTTRSKRVSHVGVYVGENRFVHAPQSGKLIELRNLDDAYYGARLVGSGRLYPDSCRADC